MDLLLFLCLAPSLLAIGGVIYWRRSQAPARRKAGLLALAVLGSLTALVELARVASPKRLDGIGLLVLLAITLTPLAGVASWAIWTRWTAAPLAKVLVVLGLFLLLVPGSCFGLVIAGEGLGLLAPYHP